MDTRTVTTFFALLALACNAVVVGFVALWVTSRFSAVAAEWRAVVEASFRDWALAFAWVIALVCTLGSLWYSEFVGFEPCGWCWFQRIAMYPLAVILGIGAWRRDRTLWIYAVPLTIAGGAFSAYHYLLQRFPDLETGVCSTSVPCSSPYVERFGFVTLPFMALSAFALMALLLWLSRGAAEAEDAPVRSARTQ